MKKYGTSKAFIASNIGLTRGTVTLWLKDERSLSDEALKRINIWLESLN